MRSALLGLVLLAACAGSRALAPESGATLQAAAARGALPVGQPVPPTALAPLADRIAAANIIGLGRPLAGGREFVALARELLRDLVDRHGVTGLALDVDVQTGLALDAWARGHGGDLDALVLELDEPALRNAEVRALLDLVRERNAAPDHKTTLRIHGCDPGELDPAAKALLEYLRAVDPEHVQRASSAIRDGDVPATAALPRRLDERRADYTARSSAAAFARARVQAEVVAQLTEQADSWSFDAPEYHRARNLDLALQLDGPGAKLLLWAENHRVAADAPGQNPAVGEYLRKWHGAAYLAIGGLFVRGGALLERPGPRLCPTDLPPASSGSFDAVFADLAGPALLLVPELLRDPGLARALRIKPAIRAIEGPYDPADAFKFDDIYKKLDDSFDALLVVPTVTPAAVAPGLGRPGPDGCIELL